MSTAGANPTQAAKAESATPLQDERCECGNLLCKVSRETVEIKCRRCKRIHVIPIERLASQ